LNGVIPNNMIAVTYFITILRTRFTIWLSSTWNTNKKCDSKVGSFIGKAAPLIRTVGNVMSYFPGKIGEIGKANNHYGGMIDSFTDLLSNNPIKNQIIKYTGNINQAYLQQQNPIKYGVLTPS
jgi:hypothetical protein